MAITFRANKGQALTYAEMDTNLGSYFYSSSVSVSGSVLYLHYTGSSNVPVNQGTHEIPLPGQLPAGVNHRIPFYTGSATLVTNDGFIADRQEDGTVHVGINVDETNDAAFLTYELEVSGSIRASAVVYQGSDKRYKENIETIDDGLIRVLNSRGVKYNRDGNAEVGVIAQEIQNSIPEVVSEDNNGYLSVNYNGLVGVLIEAVKEQDKLIQDLYSRVQNLENNN